MTTTNLNGVSLYRESAGAGERIVLTHGSWTDATGWQPSVAVLAERYEVVTWDRRGHSRSQDGDGPGSRAEDTADLAPLIEHLGGGPVHVVGNSYGAIITLTLVTTVPIWSPVPPCTSRPCSACWTSPPMRRSPTRWLPAAEGSLPSPG